MDKIKVSVPLWFARNCIAHCMNIPVLGTDPKLHFGKMDDRFEIVITDDDEDCSIFKKRGGQ